MSSARSDAKADIDKLIDAMDDLIRSINASKRVLKRASKALGEGSGIATTLAATRAGETRAGTNDALQVLESARHNSRLSIFAAGLDEGMTIGDLARAWGFSRQLASRYAKEARAKS